MKKILTKIQLFFYTIPLMLISSNVYADGTECSDAYGGVVIGKDGFSVKQPCTKTVDKTFEQDMGAGSEVLWTLFEFIFAIAGITGMISLVVGAVQFAMSAGNQRQKEHAMKRIKASLLVMAVLGGFWAIVKIFFNLFRA